MPFNRLFADTSHFIRLTDKKCVLVRDLFRRHGLLELVWFLKDDIDCYVRTAVIQLIGVLSTKAHVWKEFCQVAGLSEVTIITGFKIAAGCRQFHGTCRQLFNRAEVFSVV